MSKHLSIQLNMNHHVAHYHVNTLWNTYQANVHLHSESFWSNYLYYTFLYYLYDYHFISKYFAASCTSIIVRGIFKHNIYIYFFFKLYFLFMILCIFEYIIEHLI